MMPAGSNPVGRRDSNLASIALTTVLFNLCPAEQRGVVSRPMSLFRKQPSFGLSCLSASLLLSGCGEAGPECGSPKVRDAVVKTVAADRNNPLLNYAVQNSGSVAEQVNSARAKARSANDADAEAEKLAIWEKAKKGAIYALDDTIIVNSRNRTAATCTGLLYVMVGDTTAQKQVEFRVERTADGKTSVSVQPFLF